MILIHQYESQSFLRANCVKERLIRKRIQCVSQIHMRTCFKITILTLSRLYTEIEAISMICRIFYKIRRHSNRRRQINTKIVHMHIYCSLTPHFIWSAHPILFRSSVITTFIPPPCFSMLEW